MSEDEQRTRAREAREALIGRTIAGRYVLRALIGHGGMGAVYEAEHVGLGKKAAIKFIDSEFATDEQVVQRFAREARAMSTVESAHIVTVFDAGAEDGRPYLVMELLRGEDLGQRLRRKRVIGIPEAMHVVAQVLKGLARAHAAGIVHRDLKPDNVFITKSDTDPSFAKIVDFGISKIARPRNDTVPLALTGRGTVLGTPFYMSPEQAQSSAEVDGRADLYSVGAILFECLSGRPPHTGESYEQVILSIVMREAPDLRAVEPKVPENVAAFVARALARDKNLRFQSAERMLAALHEIAPEERARVPLDPPAGETMLSSGVLPAAEVSRTSDPVFAKTVLDGSRASQEAIPIVDPLPVSAKPPSIQPPSRQPSSVPRKKKKKASSMMLVGTALAATLTGVAVMLAIVNALEKKVVVPPPMPSVVATTSHEVPPPPSVSAAPSALPSVAPSASALPSAGTKPIVGPRPPSSGRPAGSGRLDINRELP